MSERQFGEVDVNELDGEFTIEILPPIINGETTMTIFYTITDENGDLIREGKCDIADVHYVVWNELDNGHTVVVSPYYESEEDEA